MRLGLDSFCYSRALLTVMALLVGLTIVSPSISAEKTTSKKAVEATMKTQKSDYIRMDRLPGQLTRATLKNGLTVLVQENHVAPVATVRCYVKNTGGMMEGRWLGMGLSHLLEHLVAGGSTTKRSEDEIEKIIDRFGGASNAYTSAAQTAYFIDCPTGNVMTCVDLIAEQMQFAKISEDEYAREKEVVQRELADGEVDRRRVMWKMLQETVYPDHPARTPTIGYLDVLKTATRQDCIEFYKERYVPNNQVFVVVGDIETDLVLDRIAGAYAETPRGRETYIPMEPKKLQLSPREAVHEMDGKTFEVMLAWPTVELSNNDLYALDVAAYILGQGESSRLVQKVKYEKQLALSVSTASYTPSYVKGLFVVSSTMEPSNRAAAIEEILSEVYRLCKEPVSAEELEKAKKQKAAELVFGQQTVQQTARSIGQSVISVDDPLFDIKYVENIQKVTAEQIQDVARRFLVPERLNTVMIAPLGESPKKKDEGGSGDQGEIHAVKLPNGVRVLIKRHSHLPLVSMQAYVLGGQLIDTPKTAGRARLVGKMLDKGTAKYSAEQIANYFDSIGGTFSTASGRNTLFASATVLRDDYPKAFGILADCFLRSTFPPEEFEKVKRLALGEIARRDDNPQQQILELFYDQLPLSSPYHLLQGGKKETVEPLTVDDIRGFHQKYFKADNLIVTIFGDVETEEAVKMALKQFGQVPAGDKDVQIDFDRSNALPKSIVKHKKVNKDTAMVLLGYPEVSILDKEDYAALTVLDAIMSGYSYPGGWLHKELRGEGLVYMVHAFQITGPAPGFFSVISKTRPEMLSEVVGRIEKNMKKARDGKITKEEFDTAVEMIISLHAQENTTIGEQARQAALDDLYGLGYNYEKGFSDRIKAVTLDKVIEVARKYLSGNSVLVTISPDEKVAK
jgi:zinc protease